MRMSLPGAVASLVVVAGVVVAPPALAAPGSGGRAAAVVDHWTADRLAAAQPRDLVVDDRGLGYQRRADGRLAPHGHRTPAASPTTRGKPSGGATAGPTVTGMSPAAGTTIGQVRTFTASVSDPDGVASVTFTLTGPNRRTTSHPATDTGGVWTADLRDLAPGKWSWTVRATDGRGNASTSSKVAFSVSSTPPSDSPITANAPWPGGGSVQSAAGRVYFEMPDSAAVDGWSGYVCSGTVVTDEATDESVILTAAHCVYDDVNKVFAQHVLFIPDQAASGTPTDVDCDNDRYGCWTPSHGVVDRDWAIRTFPDNIPWDYAYYVVPTGGAHSGTEVVPESLEEAVDPLTVDFSEPAAGLSGTTTDRTHALGYSYSDDPDFMYCTEDMTTEGADNWWLPSCALSGGASGGPWLQPVLDGDGPIISVNSWGYTNRPGMAGPKLVGTSASALLDAINAGQSTTQDRGAVLG